MQKSMRSSLADVYSVRPTFTIHAFQRLGNVTTCRTLPPGFTLVSRDTAFSVMAEHLTLTRGFSPQRRLQPPLPNLPIRHDHRQQVPPIRAVIGMQAVREFVGNHVVDQIRRGSN